MIFPNSLDRASTECGEAPETLHAEQDDAGAHWLLYSNGRVLHERVCQQGKLLCFLKYFYLQFLRILPIVSIRVGAYFCIHGKSCVKKLLLPPEGDTLTRVMSRESASVGAEDYKFDNENLCRPLLISF